MTNDLALDIWLAAAQDKGRTETETAREALAYRVMRSTRYKEAQERAKKLAALCSVEPAPATEKDRAVLNGGAL